MVDAKKELAITVCLPLACVSYRRRKGTGTGYGTTGGLGTTGHVAVGGAPMISRDKWLQNVAPLGTTLNS